MTTQRLRAVHARPSPARARPAHRRTLGGLPAAPPPPGDAPARPRLWSGSITAGLAAGRRAVGVDVAPVRPSRRPRWRPPTPPRCRSPTPASARSTPAPAAARGRPSRCSARRRVARPGAVIGVGDADWGGVLMHPPITPRRPGHPGGPATRRRGPGRAPARSLLTAAGFERCEASATGGGDGTADAPGGSPPSKRRGSRPPTSSPSWPNEASPTPTRWPPSPPRGPLGRGPGRVQPGSGSPARLGPCGLARRAPGSGGGEGVGGGHSEVVPALLLRVVRAPVPRARQGRQPGMCLEQWM